MKLSAAMRFYDADEKAEHSGVGRAKAFDYRADKAALHDG